MDLIWRTRPQGTTLDAGDNTAGSTPGTAAAAVTVVAFTHFGTVFLILAGFVVLLSRKQRSGSFRIKILMAPLRSSDLRF